MPGPHNYPKLPKPSGRYGIRCTGSDPLRDEGHAYAKALQAAGVQVAYHTGEGLIHGYFGLGDAPEAARAEAQRARADFKVLLEKGV